MEPKKIWENLTVLDVERTRTFYTALGPRFLGSRRPQMEYISNVSNPEK